MDMGRCRIRRAFSSSLLLASRSMAWGHPAGAFAAAAAFAALFFFVAPEGDAPPFFLAAPPLVLGFLFLAPPGGLLCGKCFPTGDDECDEAEEAAGMRAFPM